MDMEHLPVIIHACFVLHKYCGVHKETISKQSINAALQYNKDIKPPSRATIVRTDNETEGNQVRHDQISFSQTLICNCSFFLKLFLIALFSPLLLCSDILHVI